MRTGTISRREALVEASDYKSISAGSGDLHNVGASGALGKRIVVQAAAHTSKAAGSESLDGKRRPAPPRTRIRTQLATPIRVRERQRLIETFRAIPIFRPGLDTIMLARHQGLSISNSIPPCCDPMLGSGI